MSRLLNLLLVPRNWVVVLAAAALLLHSTTFVLAEPGHTAFLLKLLGASVLPYLVIVTVALLTRWPAVLLPAMAAMLAADIAAFLSVVVWPTDAQAPLILLFMPLWNIAIVAPAALLVTVLVRWG